MTKKQLKKAVAICKEKALAHISQRYYWLKYDRFEVDKFNAIHLYFIDSVTFDFPTRQRLCHYVFLYENGEWQIHTVVYG